MERILTVRDVGQQRLLFQVFFDGLCVKMWNKWTNSRAVYKTFSFTRQKRRYSALKSLSLQSCQFAFFRQRKSLPTVCSHGIEKWPSIYSVDSVSQFHKLANFSSLLQYSTQSKPNQKFDSSVKDFQNLSHSVEHNSTAKSWDLPPSQVLDSGFRVKDFSMPKAEHVASGQADAKITHLPPNAVSSIADMSDNSDVTKGSRVDSVEKKPGLFKRFHQTYKQYGKVLVGVHIFTSSIWTGVFYVTAMSGVNVEPFLRWVGAGDTIVSFYTMPGVGHLAVAYLMYKLATPARYAVTIGGTHMAVKWLTHWGYMKPIPESNSIKSLVKDGKTKVKAKYEKYQDKIDDIRDELKEFTSKESKTK